MDGLVVYRTDCAKCLLAAAAVSFTLPSRMRYDPPIHHRRSIRLPAYDYRDAGAYFVTICTHRRGCTLTDPRIARLLLRIWARTVCGGRYPSEGEFVVMPNHVHGIVRIRGKEVAPGASNVGASRPFRRNDNSHRNGVAQRNCGLVSVDGSPLRVDHATTPRRAERGSLGARIASFKTQSTLAMNRLRMTPGVPAWQRNYHEHIIRNEEISLRVREYIRDNPAKWDEDPDNPDGRD